MRRIWPRLAREPVRRAIEVAELFADGRATEPEVERAARAATQVKRGDRRANRAAGLLAEFCSGTSRFPPGNISNAVIDAVVGQRDDPAAGAAERKTHLDLLHDIFGPLPFREVPIDPAWLAWNNGTIPRLAEAAYNERQPDRRLDRGHDRLLEPLGQPVQDAVQPVDLLGQ